MFRCAALTMERMNRSAIGYLGSRELVTRKEGRAWESERLRSTSWGNAQSAVAYRAVQLI